MKFSNLLCPVQRTESLLSPVVLIPGDGGNQLEARQPHIQYIMD